MQVKVQYTVDLEDIPREVSKLMPKLLDFTPEIADIEGLLDEGMPVRAIEAIESLRKSLFQTDQRLADGQAILRGYLGVTSQDSDDSPSSEEKNDSVG